MLREHTWPLTKRPWVFLPLFKAANADQGLLDLLLNSLIAAKVRRRKAVMVPQGTSIYKIPAPLFTQKQKVLAKSWADKFADSMVLLECNHTRHMCWATVQQETNRCHQGSTLNGLVKDFIALLDNGLQQGKAIL